MAVLQNIRIARRLEEAARLLDEQGANPYRVQAYRHAADTVRLLAEPVTELLRKHGEEGLRSLPGIGESLARAIRDVALTGSLPMLQRLRGRSDPELLLASVPGIGKTVAQRLHHDLGIDSLEDLEMAAHDGRLKELAGIGDKRLAGIIDSLASRLAHVRGERPARLSVEPPVGELLDVDREYREKATSGTLRKLAPRRFNPRREPWLPILHTHRRDRNYTALFSNTARAHELGKTLDWVVLYCERTGIERQYTVITSQRGFLKGKRIIRGREAECADYYRLRNSAGTAQPSSQSDSPAKGAVAN